MLPKGRRNFIINITCQFFPLSNNYRCMGKKIKKKSLIDLKVGELNFTHILTLLFQFNYLFCITFMVHFICEKLVT